MIVVRFFALSALIWLMLSLSAGDFALWNFAVWVGILFSTGAFTYVRLAPDVVRERMRPPSDRDRATRRLVALPFTMLLVGSGLDARFGLTHVPLALQVAGMLLVALGFALTGWVLLSNPFASSAVRIQGERSQTVISTGPYRIVRHPMYLAVMLVCIGSGPALRSWIGALAMLPVMAIFIRRTAIEDRMLHEELAGYARYAERVRYRIIPLIY